MHVRPAAGAVRKRLGHESSDGPVSSSGFRSQHLEKDESIGGRQGVCILEIDLELGVGVLVIGLVHAPIELLQGVVHVPQIVSSCR